MSNPTIHINTPRINVTIPHGSGGKEEVFWATYGTTTNAEIEAAYQAGKIVACQYNSSVYILHRRSSDTFHHFYCPISGYLYGVSCVNNSWTAGYTQIAPVLSPTFTGTPTAPTASPGTDTTQLATTEFVQQEIANIVAGGLSEALKTALLQLAQKVVYIDDDGADYYQDLYNALYGSVTTYTITNNLTAVTNSNAASTITEGTSYSATLSCAQDYEITSVTITMGGNDVTGTSYSSGTISIANVTGNIVITAVATQQQATLSSISAVFSQGQAVIYNTDSLDTLKQYLVVTASWSDSTTSTVASSDYTLSGTLTVGTSTITVSYGGKTDTFTVTVTKAILWTFTDGYSVGKATSGTYANKIYKQSTTARACGSAPIENKNYTFTVTDSTKYNIAAYDVTSLTEITPAPTAAVDGICYQGGTKSISWKTSDSVSSEYVWVSLKKMDNTAFTNEELENGAEAVFTYTTS